VKREAEQDWVRADGRKKALRSNFAFRIDMWTDDDYGVGHMAGAIKWRTRVSKQLLSRFVHLNNEAPQVNCSP